MTESRIFSDEQYINVGEAVEKALEWFRARPDPKAEDRLVVLYDGSVKYLTKTFLGLAKTFYEVNVYRLDQHRTPEEGPKNRFLAIIVREF